MGKFVKSKKNGQPRRLHRAPPPSGQSTIELPPHAGGTGQMKYFGDGELSKDGTELIQPEYKLKSVRPLGVGVPVPIREGSRLDSDLDPDTRYVVTMEMHENRIVLVLDDGAVFAISNAPIVTEFTRVDELPDVEEVEAENDANAVGATG